MGVFNAVAITMEVAVVLWYATTPISHGHGYLLVQDFRDIFKFKQSFASMAILSISRLLLFIYIRRQSKQAPATRCFVFFVFLIMAILGTLACLPPLIFFLSTSTSSYRRYRALGWGSTFVFTLWMLSISSTVLQLGYILRLNKSRGRLADEKLLRDVLGTSQKKMASNDTLGTLWRAKWLQLVKQFKKKQTDPTFEAMVRLYAHRDGALERLVAAYDRNPMAFEFYLPQLCSFMLAHCGSVLDTQLCMLLLDKCGVSHIFAHKMAWYLQSYCVQNPAFGTEEAMKRVDMLMQEVAHRGVEPARAIEKQKEVMENEDVESVGRTSARHSAAYEVEALLPSRHDLPEQEYHTFHDQMLLEAGGMSSDPFELETTFLMALANLSSNLRAVPLGRRNDSLRSWLSDLSTQYLPSNALYLPVGNPYHRLKRMHVTESFTFSTRERVPYLLCAEVVDYSSLEEKACRQRKRTSLFHGRFPLNLWERSSQLETHSAVPMADKTPLVSPDATKLGFWSESSKAALSPRSRTISHSIPQPTELLHGIIETFVRKTPVGKTATKGTNQEALLKREESPSERRGSQSFATAKSTQSLDTDQEQSGAVAPRSHHEEEDDPSYPVDDEPELWSPRSASEPPSSPGSPFSPPSLSRFDSTDRYLQTLSERDSKEVEDEDDDEDPAIKAPPSSNLSRLGAELPPCVIFKERWADKEARIRLTSPWSHLPGWRLVPVIIKSNDDLRQEQLASQLIHQFARIFDEAKLPVFLRPYDVIAISSTSGMVEAIADTISIDSLKRNDRAYTTLLDFFIRHFGDPSTSEFRQAKANFVASMAAYSIVCYLLQVKDRHNGNLLLDAEGHIIHIDFGFMLANNPGNMAFEQAPFKLTSEFVALMGGPRSASFRRFRSLCVRSFLVARKYRHRFILLVEMLVQGNESLPCFAGDPKATVERLAARFQPDLDINSCEDFVHDLIDASLDNWRTKWYDKYQRWCVGVF